MLIIYDDLALGGIQTFFIRMAKERAKKGLYTAILLFSKTESSDQELMEQMLLTANVFFYEDFFSSRLPALTRFPLLSRFNSTVVKDVLQKVSQIHVVDGMHALIGNRLNKEFGLKLPITIGFYHYLKYAWGEGRRLSYSERVNREFVFEYLNCESLLFFSNDNKDFYSKLKSLNLSKSNTFRLGVVDRENSTTSGKLRNPLRIAAVGRLVDFKSYNLFMINVISRLIDRGYAVIFDVYGTGPLIDEMRNRLDELNLSLYVTLKGSVNYSKFDETVREYDLFIGSGTSVIQAAALGIPSIIGIENMSEPKTYGYFSDVCQHEYNMRGLNLPLIGVEELIIDFFNLSDDERLTLKAKHVSSIEPFVNESCQDSMDALSAIPMPSEPFKFSLWFYEISRILNQLNIKFNRKHPYRTQFTDLKDF